MRRKKYRIKSKFRFTVFIALTIVMTVFAAGNILGVNDAASLSEEAVYKTVQIQSGDTLWNLASEYGPSGADRRQLIYEICQLNDIQADSIQPGQTIQIPDTI